MRQIRSCGIVVDNMEGVRVDDDELADVSRRDDRHHLAQLFDREFDGVFRFCLARTGDVAAADDAASETFVAAARVFAEGRGHEVDRPWLFVVAKNRMVDQWRSLERRQRRLRRLAQHRQSDDGDQDPVAASALADQVLAALASLPERQRAALALRYLDDNSVSEVAEQLDVTYQAAESLLARARRSFAAAWEHHHGR